LAIFAAIRRASRFGAARRKLFRPVTLPSARNMQRSKREFYGQNQAKAEAKLNEWKKKNASAVSIVAQIIEMPSADSTACVIRVEYETASNDR
jgi:hypothetical protein